MSDQSTRLGMTTEDTTLTLETAVKEGENLSEEQREVRRGVGVGGVCWHKSFP